MSLIRMLSLPLSLALSMVAMATPVPFSALGINKTVEVTDFAFGGPISGGAFTAVVDGYLTTVWCVDIQNSIDPGDPSATYTANVTALDAWIGGINPEVRKGTVTGAANWGDGSDLTALQRYQAAAYLVQQFDSSPNGPTTPSAANQAIQNAIWHLTYANGVPSSHADPGPNAEYLAAKAFLENPANANFGFGNWAVISGVALPDGTLTSNGRQTFLVQYIPDRTDVPEPASLAMIGGGLILFASVRLRRTA